MAKFCSNCGNEIKGKEKTCSNCGSKVDTPSSVTITNNITTPTNTSNGLAIAGFVVSLVSSLLCCGSFNMVGLILSIVGLVKSKELNGSGKGLAIAGIVICSLVFVISIIITIIYYGAAITSAIARSV